MVDLKIKHTFDQIAYDDQLDYWISEKDNGIYDAWNRGIQLSKATLA